MAPKAAMLCEIARKGGQWAVHGSRNRLTVRTQNVLEGSGTEVESLQDTVS